VQAHRRRRADVTVAVKRVPIGEASRFGILALGGDDRVADWQEKPRQPKSDLASFGIYVFLKRALEEWLDESRTDFGRDIIPAMFGAGARVFGHRFDGYWQDVGTIQSYWQAHMELLDEHPALDLYDREWLIHTRSEERAPARIGPTASVHRSLISHGCQVWGTVERSVLSPGVRVDPGAVVRDSIVMFDAVIRAGAVVDHVIIDKEVSIGPNAVVGFGADFDIFNRSEPERLNTGITVVGKRAVVFNGVRRVGDLWLAISIGLLAGVTRMFLGFLVASVVFVLLFVVLMLLWRLGRRSHVPFGSVLIGVVFVAMLLA
jgi:glucose-1-phosphate adenylyltransferase